MGYYGITEKKNQCQVHEIGLKMIKKEEDVHVCRECLCVCVLGKGRGLRSRGKREHISQINCI